MARCCGETCACKIEAGPGMDITGTGTLQDPFVISSGSSNLTVQDTTNFNMSLTGDGSDATPWVISTTFAAGAKLDNIPDVNAGSATNGQALTWDSGTSTWVATTIPPVLGGSIYTSGAIDGDGSVGDPLILDLAATGLLQQSGNELGVTDAGRNLMIRKFANAAARTAASPALTDGSFTVLLDDPDTLYVYAGGLHLEINMQITVGSAGEQLLNLSGAYAVGARVRKMVHSVSGTTDSNGDLVVLPNSLLTGYAGVLSAQWTETGTLPYKGVLRASGGDHLKIRAFQLDTGGIYPTQNVTGQIEAILYLP